MNLKEKVKQVKSGKLKAVENVMNFGKEIEKVNDNLNIFLHRNEEAISQAKEIDKRIKEGKRVGKLAGLCFAVKPCICVKGLTTNCASKVLENFVAPFNASVINKLISEDAIILGMVNMDEFACGWTGETSAFGPTKNPKNPELIPGGSSSGSAAAVAANLCDFALGTDTGGSIRNPASHCGIAGLKPTYGAVSRYGLIDMTMSFDQIGPLANSTEDTKLIFDIIKGQDNFDATTRETKPIKKKKKYKIGLVDVSKFATKEIAEKIHSKTHELAKKKGWKITSVELPLEIAIQTYYILVFTEFFSATRKFDGRRFGFKIEEKAGPEVTRRIIGGKEITLEEHKGKYYQNALRARAYIKEQFKKIFQDVDALILPTVPRTAHKLNEEISEEEMEAYDVLTCLQNIAGVPAISIPGEKVDGKELGTQIIAPHFHEEILFEIGKEFEKNR